MTFNVRLCQRMSAAIPRDIGFEIIAGDARRMTEAMDMKLARRNNPPYGPRAPTEFSRHLRNTQKP